MMNSKQPDWRTYNWPCAGRNISESCGAVSCWMRNRLASSGHVRGPRNALREALARANAQGATALSEDELAARFQLAWSSVHGSTLWVEGGVRPKEKPSQSAQQIPPSAGSSAGVGRWSGPRSLPDLQSSI
jgi:hypothetical protein